MLKLDKDISMRASNIELLRILAIAGVILLHYNNPQVGGGLRYIKENTLNHFVLMVLESLCICAVDLFILVTGYFMSQSYRRTLWKPLQLILQVIIFSTGWYLIEVIVGVDSFGLKRLVARLIPANYFVILYITLYLISPYINIVLNILPKRKLNQMLILLLLLFSVWPTLVDCLTEVTEREWMGLSTIGAYGSQWGYSIVNFILMYIIGATLRLFKDSFAKVILKRSKLMGVLIICVLILTVWSFVNEKTGYYTERSAWEYCNFIVITEAVLIFLLFAGLHIKPNIFINGVAKGAFTVFLSHSYFFKYIGIEKVVNSNICLLLGHIIFSSIIIYCLCWCIWWLYDKLTKPVYQILSKFISISEINLDNIVEEIFELMPAKAGRGYKNENSIR